MVIHHTHVFRGVRLFPQGGGIDGADRDESYYGEWSAEWHRRDDQMNVIGVVSGAGAVAHQALVSKLAR
jgi:hypothetical protein